jgi:hypothetical protein
MNALKQLPKGLKLNLAIASLGVAVVFYTIAGVIVALSPNEVETATKNMSPTSLVNDDSYPDQLSKVQIAARVMPSQNEEFNSQLMAPSTDPSHMTGYYADGIVDDVTDDRFEISSFANYFPDFHFMSEYMPMGSSKPYCLHLDWIDKKRASMRDRYLSVLNMPFCWGATSPKVRWESSYPKAGLDFQIFKQFSKEASNADACDSNSLYKERKTPNTGGYCYSYQVIDAICLRVAFVVDRSANTYSWQYVNGCFDNGSIAHYVQATPDTVVDFSNLSIEVRQTNSLP